jgi:hypothetical protein
MEQEHKESALTMQELIALINNTEEDFLISIPLDEEADTNAKEE